MDAIKFAYFQIFFFCSFLPHFQCWTLFFPWCVMMVVGWRQKKMEKYSLETFEYKKEIYNKSRKILKLIEDIQNLLFSVPIEIFKNLTATAGCHFFVHIRMWKYSQSKKDIGGKKIGKNIQNFGSLRTKQI